MKTKTIQWNMILLGIVLFSAMTWSCVCPPCPPCYRKTGSYPNCGCAWNCGSGICCNSSCCNYVCCNNSCCTGVCCNNACCYGVCCNNSCCTGVCCEGSCCYGGDTCCGSSCCLDGQECCDGDCCDFASSCCDGTCCNDYMQTCCNGECCNNSEATCCDGQTCCDNLTQQCCHGNCCDNDQICCDDGSCLPEAQACDIEYGEYCEGPLNDIPCGHACVLLGFDCSTGSYKVYSHQTETICSPEGCPEDCNHDTQICWQEYECVPSETFVYTSECTNIIIGPGGTVITVPYYSCRDIFPMPPKCYSCMMDEIVIDSDTIEADSCN